MNRTLFYTKNTIDGKEELDFLYNSLSNFKMTYAPTYYRVVSSDLMRPDMISYKNYGTVKYWWIILYVNGIGDPFYGISTGDVLKIPNLLDLYNFYRKYKVR
jgi:hypothetical protein